MQQDASRENALTVVAPFSPGSHSLAFGQPVRAYHFTAPRPTGNLLSPRGTRGCPHRGSPGRPHDGASSARSWWHPIWLLDRSQRGTVRFRRPQGSIDSRSEQRLQHGETTEHLPWCFCLGPATSPLLYVRLRTRDATDLAWTASGLERDGVKKGILYFAVSTHSLFCSIRDHRIRY